MCRGSGRPSCRLDSPLTMSRAHLACRSALQRGAAYRATLFAPGAVPGGPKKSVSSRRELHRATQLVPGTAGGSSQDHPLPQISGGQAAAEVG